ncbi:hypothetical protein OAA95_01275 [Pelagibacteraceae bacterium]|nr:hypothetical protein [Pelagibacteraceae bacterium]
MKSEKTFDVIVLGSGLSSLSFIESYLKNKKSVNVISPKSNNNNNENEINKHVYKFLPPQMLGEKKKVENYFFQNKLRINTNCKVFGSLEFGGLSNYWALQVDNNIENDISDLKQDTKKKLKASFKELFYKNVAGENLKSRPSKTQKFLELFKKDNKMIIDYPILGYFKKKDKSFNLDNINEDKDKLVPKNFFNKYLKKKKIIFHDYCVKKILKDKNQIILICIKNKEEKIFKTKKLVIGCGTIVTTKLLMEFLNIKSEVKIKHHPRLFSLYLAKNRWKNNMNFQPSLMHLKYKKFQDLFTADFRPGNKVIINSLIKLNFTLRPLKFLFNYFRQYFIFSNIFLSSKYSNLFIKLEKNSWATIYSKDLNIKKIFNKISKNIYKFLLSQKKIFSFRVNRFPGYGVDFHYFGTIPINGKNKLSVNENCQLKKNKNIYIIDGSVFDFKKNKYPLGLIMANARRIAKII